MEKRSTFLRIQDENEPKNNSAGFGRLSSVSGVIPNSMLDCFMTIVAFVFEAEYAVVWYSIV